MLDSSAGSGLHDLDITSGDMEARGLHSERTPGRVASTTAPLEVKEMPAGLAKTLENIVGQLDVLTQVTMGL